jgi:hypothetical protein
MTQPPAKVVTVRYSLESILFWAILLVCVSPVWFLSQMPTQDGPAHLYNGYLLSGWWKGSFPIDRTFFALNPAPVPNWLSTAILALLMQAVSPLLAERLLLTSYIVLFPVAFRYASRSFDRIPRYTYFLGFALVWNHLFSMGFLNYCLSLVWYLFFIGYWARSRAQFGATQVIVSLGFSLLLYFSNGLSYYLAVSALGLASIAWLITESRRDGWWKEVLKPQAGLLLAMPLSVGFFALHGRSQAAVLPHISLGAITWSMTRVPILASSFNAIDLKLSAVFGILLFVAIVIAIWIRRGRRWSFSDALLIAAVIQFVLYIVLPERAFGGAVNYRVFLFALVTLTLWVSIQPYEAVSGAVISAAATIICLGLIARDFQRNLWLSAALDEYREAGAQIEEHKSFLRLQFEPTGYGTTRDPGLRYDPFLNYSAFVALDRNLVDLDNYETASRNFPIVYREGFDPMTVIRREGPSPYRPLADISGYEAMTGRTVDYVLLWDVQRWNPESPFGKMALQQLYRDYVLIYCARNIPLQLYRLRGLANSAAVATNCPVASASK